mgnify:CR=1 FL=1|jgi:DNA-binding MarR family transcriptional regulator
MDYVIKNEKEGYYIPAIPFWIMDDLKLKGIEAQLYAIILSKGYLTWTAPYTANVLRCSSKTILRAIQSLSDAGVIEKVSCTHKGVLRLVLISLYTKEGRRDAAQVKKFAALGLEKIKKMYY